MDFVVLKVNGKDVSSASHEDTIAAFTTAQEPIIVEVLKRPPKADEMGTESLSMALCNTSTQTEWTGAWDAQSAGFLPFAPNNLIQQTSNQIVLGNDIGNHYSTIAGDPDAEDDDGCDVEYEEVTLHRNQNGAKLGLTLCYGAPDEPETDIYISEIDPESIAAKDGRIQEGDQLLQINGIDVRCRDQAVNLFSEKRSDFTLLFARPQIPVEEFLLDEHSTDFGVCQGYNILLEQEEEDGTTDTGTAENAHLEKDSGVGRTDESTKNDESSDHEAADMCSFSGDLSSRPNGSLACIHDLNSVKDSDSCTDDIALKQEIRRFRAQLAAKGMALAPLCRFQSDTSLDREMALLNKEMENIQLECETLVHRHLESQQKGGASTDGKCQLEHVYVNLSDLNPPKSGHAVPLSKQESVERWVNSMVLPRKGLIGQQDRDSSSAYNTADSSGSLPLTLELTPMSIRHGDMYGSVMSLVSPKMEDKGTQLRESDVASMFSCDSCRRCCKALVEKEGLSSVVSSVTRNFVANNNATNTGSINRKVLQNKGNQSTTERDCTLDRQREEKNKNYVTFFPGPNTMYTNQANLQHTIWLQQQMLRQAMAHQKVSKSGSSNSGSSTQNGTSTRGIGLNSKHAISSVNKIQTSSYNYSVNGHPISSSPSKSGTLSTLREDEELKMEWKVKKRADGTRYITRRPVRNRLLKARAMKILEERAGLTTDDDAMSELKIGRYWSKEERKRHLERARDRKRKEMVIRTKMTSVKEQGEDGEDISKKEINILELSHKKMMKKRGKVVFDDFTTVQEVLAHGTKVANAGGKPLGLLTVTTV